jgi:hypothetical protein
VVVVVVVGGGGGGGVFGRGVEIVCVCMLVSRSLRCCGGGGPACSS